MGEQWVGSACQTRPTRLKLHSWVGLGLGCRVEFGRKILTWPLAIQVAGWEILNPINPTRTVNLTFFFRYIIIIISSSQIPNPSNFPSFLLASHSVLPNPFRLQSCLLVLLLTSQLGLSPLNSASQISVMPLADDDIVAASATHLKTWRCCCFCFKPTDTKT